MLSGAFNYLAIAEWASDLPQDLLCRLGCKYHPEKRKYIAPSEPTLRRHLQGVDANEFDRIVNEWLAEQTGPDAIAVDGKTVRGRERKRRQASPFALCASA
jgi:hypothetical protein